MSMERTSLTVIVAAAATLSFLAALSAPHAVTAATAPTGPLPERVTFMSMDGATTLVGYVFKPQGAHPARTPAVVMMHGRAGAYSSLANGDYSAATLSKRHQEWGHIWAQQGYLAVLVDGFGPRGYPQGFARFSYDQRPEALNEVTVRPLDAYGALALLAQAQRCGDGSRRVTWLVERRQRHACQHVSDRARHHRADASHRLSRRTAFYPACGLKGQFTEGLMPYAPVRVFQGSADEEVSPRRCAELVEKSAARGGDIQLPALSGRDPRFRRSLGLAPGQRSECGRDSGCHPARDKLFCDFIQVVTERIAFTPRRPET